MHLFSFLLQLFLKVRTIKRGICALTILPFVFWQPHYYWITYLLQVHCCTHFSHSIRYLESHKNPNMCSIVQSGALKHQDSDILLKIYELLDFLMTFKGLFSFNSNWLWPLIPPSFTLYWITGILHQLPSWKLHAFWNSSVFITCRLLWFSRCVPLYVKATQLFTITPASRWFSYTI